MKFALGLSTQSGASGHANAGVGTLTCLAMEARIACGGFSPASQHTARPTHVQQQHREPEPARRSPTFADKIEILAAEGEVTGDFPARWLGGS